MNDCLERGHSNNTEQCHQISQERGRGYKINKQVSLITWMATNNKKYLYLEQTHYLIFVKVQKNLLSFIKSWCHSYNQTPNSVKLQKIWFFCNKLDRLLIRQILTCISMYYQCRRTEKIKYVAHPVHPGLNFTQKLYT